MVREELETSECRWRGSQQFWRGIDTVSKVCVLYEIQYELYSMTVLCRVSLYAQLAGIDETWHQLPIYLIRWINCLR